MKPSNPAKINLRNMRRFIQGWMRFIIFKFSKDGADLKLLPKHKREQFKYRLQIMDKECLKDGHCKICGCQTPQLQMADEQCEGKEYPEMMDKYAWIIYKQENGIKI